MSASTAFGSSIPWEVGGETVDFPRLLMRDYGTLEESVRANRRAVVRAIIEHAQIKEPGEKYVALRDAELMEIQPGDVDAYLCTHAGAEKALMMALRKSGKSEDAAKEIVGKLLHPEAVRLARILIGFIRMETPDATAKKPGDADPNAVAA